MLRAHRSTRGGDAKSHRCGSQRGSLPARSARTPGLRCSAAPEGWKRSCRTQVGAPSTRPSQPVSIAGARPPVALPRTRVPAPGPPRSTGRTQTRSQPAARGRRARHHRAAHTRSFHPRRGWRDVRLPVPVPNRLADPAGGGMAQQPLKLHRVRRPQRHHAGQPLIKSLLAALERRYRRARTDRHEIPKPHEHDHSPAANPRRTHSRCSLSLILLWQPDYRPGGRGAGC
jgi:hypothetical protein